MSSEKKLYGDVCAYVPQPGGAKPRYPRVGTAFLDDRGQISVKLDTIPIPGTWSGWLNIFPPKDLRSANKAVDHFLADERPDQDVPF